MQTMQLIANRTELQTSLDDLLWTRTNGSRPAPEPAANGQPTVLLAGGNPADELDAWSEASRLQLCVGCGDARQLDQDGCFARHIRTLLHRTGWNFELVQRGVFIWRNADAVVARVGYQLDTSFQILRSTVGGSPVLFEDDGVETEFSPCRMAFVLDCGDADADDLERFQVRLDLPALISTPDPAAAVVAAVPAIQSTPSRPGWPPPPARRPPSQLSWTQRLARACASIFMS